MHQRNGFFKPHFVLYVSFVCLLIMQPQQADALFGRRLIPFLAGHIYGLYSAYKLITDKELQEKVFIQKEAKKGFASFYIKTVKNSEPIRSINESEELKDLVKKVKTGIYQKPEKYRDVD